MRLFVCSTALVCLCLTYSKVLASPGSFDCVGNARVDEGNMQQEVAVANEEAHKDADVMRSEMEKASYQDSLKRLENVFQRQKEDLEYHYRKINPSKVDDNLKQRQKRFYNSFNSYKPFGLNIQDSEMDKFFEKVYEVSPMLKAISEDLKKVSAVRESFKQKIYHLEELFYNILNEHKDIETLFDQSAQPVVSYSKDMKTLLDQLAQYVASDSDENLRMGALDQEELRIIMNKFGEEFSDLIKDLKPEYQTLLEIQFHRQNQELKDYQNQLEDRAKADSLRVQRQERLHSSLYRIFNQNDVRDHGMNKFFAKACEVSPEFKELFENLKTVPTIDEMLITVNIRWYEGLFWDILATHSELRSLFVLAN